MWFGNLHITIKNRTPVAYRMSAVPFLSMGAVHTNSTEVLGSLLLCVTYKMEYFTNVKKSKKKSNR